VKARTSQLQDALQVKSRFLAIMSHGIFICFHIFLFVDIYLTFFFEISVEIRTPLNPIMSSISILNQTSLTVEQRELVRICKVCGEQLLTVIGDILDLTKLEVWIFILCAVLDCIVFCYYLAICMNFVSQENKVELEHRPFSLQDVLEESLEVVAFDAHKKGLELICDFDPLKNDCNIIVGDATRIRQVQKILVSMTTSLYAPAFAKSTNISFPIVVFLYIDHYQPIKQLSEVFIQRGNTNKVNIKKIHTASTNCC
jgi:signal transduction histidine kinase